MFLTLSSSVYGPRARPLAFVCPRCLKLWCQVALAGKPIVSWELRDTECIDCTYGDYPWYPWFDTEGSIIDTLETRWLLSKTQDSLKQILDSLPPNIIELEFKAHLKAHDYFTREIDEHTSYP